MDLTSYLLGKKSSGGGGGGGDASEYFNTEPESVTNNSAISWSYTNYILKTPDVTIPNNVTNLSHLFNSWRSKVVPKIIFNNNVTNISHIFYNCYYVEEIDVTGFNTSNVTQLQDAFYGCNELINIKGIENLNVANVQSFSDLFYYCNKIESLNLKNWQPNNVTNINNMFNNCKKLNFLDMRNFDFTNVTSYTSTFNKVPATCLIIVANQTQKDWITGKFSSLTNVQTVEEYEASL